MKRTLLLLTLAVGCFQGHAQTADSAGIDTANMVRVYVWKPKPEAAKDTARSGRRRNFMAVGFGMSLATGRFGQTSSRPEGDGFAQSGFAARLEYAGFWNRNAGFGFAVGSFANRLDEQRMSAFFPPILTNQNINPDRVEQSFSNVRPWRSYYLFVGPYLSVPLKSVFFDFKCLGGFLLNRHPGFDYTQRVIPENNSNRFTILPSVSASFGFNAGVNVRLKMSEGTQLLVGLEYIYSQSEPRYELNDRQGNPIDAGRQKVSVFNLSWGLAWNVGKRKA